MDKLSVIIRARNEEQHIGFALQSIYDSFGKDGIEVIIADNNSTDDTMSVVNMFTHFMDIEVFTVDKYTPGLSLNSAVKQTVNDTILILSAHCKILNSSLSYVKNRLENHVAVFGKQIPIYRGKRVNPRYIWKHFTDKMSINMFSDQEDRHFLHNAFCYYDRSYLIENPFDETLVGKEDRYWAADVAEAGQTYCYDPELKVEHYFTTNGATWKGLG